MKSRKIVFFIAYPQRMAGANRSLLELIRVLPAQYETAVVLTAEGAVADAYRKASVRVLILPPGGALNHFGKRLLRTGAFGKLSIALRDVVPYQLRFFKLLRQEKADLVHVNNPRAGLMVGFAARAAGVPVVGHVRGEPAVGLSFELLYECLTHRLITVSEEVRKSLTAFGRRKAVTVHNGIGAMPKPDGGFSWIQSWREKGVVVISCFASLVPFKGHKVLLDSALELVKRGLRDRFMLVCAGDFVTEYMDYQNLLLRHAQTLDLRNLTFAGWQQDPFGLYAVSDICVLASANSGRLAFGEKSMELRGNEGFPRTILEAMLFAKPVVASDNAGVREQIIDGVTGRMVPPLNSMRLADALEELILDPLKRERMGQAGQRRVLERFSTQACRDGVCRVYDELLGPP